MGAIVNVGASSGAGLSKGRALKRANAQAAMLSGAFPGLILSAVLHPSMARWVVGVAIGLLWANGFEYFYHRFLLHRPKSSFGKGHLLHHLTTGTPQEAEQVTFGDSPWRVAALFLINGTIALAADLYLGSRLTPGILTGFTVYLIALEEIHWRIHLGGWLPPGLGWTREYHLAHHDIPSGRFNVFFPIFDFLLGNMRPPMEETQAAMMAAAVPAGDSDILAWFPALKYAALSLWIIGIAMGVRYVWSTKTRM